MCRAGGVAYPAAAWCHAMESVPPARPQRASERVVFLGWLGPGIATIDRAGCRTRALQRFAVDRMVSDYLRVYREIVADSRR
jgi:hypothetical protein